MKMMRHLITILILFLSLVGRAGLETFSERIEGGTISSGASFELYDDKHFEMSINPFWNNDFSNYSVKNYVRLGLNPGVVQDIATSGTIELVITYHTWNPTSGSFDVNTVNKTLSVNYDLNDYVTIDNLSTFAFEGAHYIKVEVATNGITGLDVNQLYLESGIAVQRFYALESMLISSVEDRPVPIPSGAWTNAEYSLPQNEFIEVYWPYHYGAESYELEWVHVNNYTDNSVSLNQFVPSTSLDYDYYLNSTRVEVTKNSYRIPNIFDQGYLIYRVRPIGRGGINFDERVEGEWSAMESGIVGNSSDHPQSNVILIDREYDAGMNWSHQVAYTENGKRFESVSFIDGLGRGRQSVARNTVTDQVVVSNVYYDELGRPVISDLPTPQDQDFPEHFPNFNIAEGTSTAYQEDVFDITNGGGICDLDSKGMDNSSGASAYYSEQNQNQDGANANIPDAENFPFTRVTYRDDFTGRVDRVASAGNTLKMGSGNETRMMYVSPNQVELNQLFGVEAGIASHYQKMITVDPNGQVYVQYSDMAGRTVATYMTGESPTNVVALPNAGSNQQYENVLLGNGQEQGVVSTPPSATLTYTQYFAESSADYDFEYTFTPQQYQDACMISPTCFDCVYDLTLSIVEECDAGTNLVSNSSIAITGGELDSLCNGLYPELPHLFTVTIPKGLYTITKTLSVNQDAIQEYWCMYIDNLNTTEECLPAVSDLFNPAYLEETFPECEPPVLTAPSVQSDCDIRRTLMLMDVSPGGQYGLYTVTNGVYSAIAPSALSNGVGMTFDLQAGGQFTPSTLEELILNWESDWAEDLLQYHPEYCFIQSGGLCDLLATSYAYDQAMMDTYTYAAACAAGYVGPLGALPTSTTWFNGCAISPQDPFFATGGPGAGYATAMTNNMNAVVTVSGTSFDLWYYTMAMVMDPNATTVAQINAAYGLYVAQNNTNRDRCDNDLWWTLFRATYLQLKDNYYQQYIDAYAAGSNCTGIPLIGLPGGAPLYDDKIPIFPTTTYITANVNQISTSNGGSGVTNIGSQTQISGAVSGMSSTACQDACEDYADDWIAQLSACYDGLDSLDASHPDYASIRQDFIDMCATGCTGNTPWPTSMPVAGSGEPTIQAILNSYGFGPESTLCSELLISEPGPIPNMVNDVYDVMKPLDDCGCDAVLQAQLDLASYPVGTTIEEVLYINTGVDLEDADHLVCSCEHIIGTSNPWHPGYVWNAGQISNLAAQPDRIPVELSCSPCLDCDDMDVHLTTLTTRFGFTSQVELSDDLDDFLAEPNAEQILANFLNQELNYSLSYSTYLDFIYACHSSTEEPYCTINPLAEKLNEVFELLAFRGQLTTTATIDLDVENIVYEQSQLKANGIGQFYISSTTGNVLTATFTDALSNTCDVTITIPSGSDFSFEDIISFEYVMPTTANCDPNNTYETEVKYISCGMVTTGIVEVYTTCFEVNECVCGADLTLCDEEEEGEDLCYQPYLDQMYQDALEAFEENVIEQYQYFEESYNAQCALAFDTEELKYTGPDRYYQYTLFYYDQSGNLVRTIAPEGPDLLTNSSLINDHRDNLTAPIQGVTKPSHEYETRYEYNSYNQLTSSTNPDQDGDTKFWYDYYGRIVASQNPVQANDNIYSYTFYDAQGRPIQVGQVEQTMSSLLTEADVKVNDYGTTFTNWVNGGTRTEITITHYDTPLGPTVEALFANGMQENLRLRVAAVLYYPVQAPFNDYESATYYSYDIHGNVKEQIQDVPALDPVDQDIKSTQYDFELISGNVREVRFQDSELDQMVHEYCYDDLNRLTEVFTSTDDIHKTREAHYRFYDYGPLARVEIGQDKVQGQDFAYTINGWIKGMNSSILDVNHDMGLDGANTYLGNNTAVHNLFARDVVSYTLGYFEGDYFPISSNAMEAITASTPFGTLGNNLFNGNIRHTVTSIYNLGTFGAAYSYDQLNRLKEMTAFENTNAVNTWSGISSTTDYYNAYDYDRNGNIISLQRNGVFSSNPSDNTLYMDDFTYNYIGLDDLPNTGNANKSNRLGHVTDSGANDANAVGDIKSGMSTNNYTYDEIGQLLSDASEEIATMEWRKGDKKLLSLTRTVGSMQSDLEFVYNPFGIRVLKIEKTKATGGVLNSQDDWNYTYYAHDANGQTMAVYDVKMGTSNNQALLEEQHIFGASRLGMLRQNEYIFDNGPVAVDTSNIYEYTTGERRYELSNHLGNVNAVISDRKMADDQDDDVNLAKVEETTSCGDVGKWYFGEYVGTTFSVSDANADGEVDLTMAHASTNFSGELMIATESAQSYTVTFDVPSSSVTSFSAAAYECPALTQLNTPVSGGAGSYSYTFTANGSESRLKWTMTGSGDITISNISIAGQGKVLIPNGQDMSDYYAVVLMTSDYYPYGMTMQSRQNSYAPGGEQYRYAYNGMEQDEEVSDAGNSYTTEFRQYDPRLGRWKSLDPLKGKYPHMSPYAAFNNNPVFFIDPLGLEGTSNGDDSGKTDAQKRYLWKRMWNKNVRQAFKDQKTKGGKIHVWKNDGEVYASRSGTRSYEMPIENSDGSIDFGVVNVGAVIYKPENKRTKSFWAPLAGGNSSTNLAISSKIFHVFFKDGGTAEKLLTHYGKGDGKSFYLTDEQIKEVFPNYSDGTGERALRFNPNSLGIIGRPIESGDLSAYASSDGTLGQFTISISGQSNLEEVTTKVSLTQKVTTTEIVFRGVVTLYDHFDFDVRGPGEDPRHGSAGFQTWVGRNFISGQGFHVYGTIEVMQIGNGPLTDMNGVPLHNQGITRKQDVH